MRRKKFAYRKLLKGFWLNTFVIEMRDERDDVK